MSRDEERKYEADVYYEVWRNGGNPDNINLDRIEDSYQRGVEVEQAISQELRSQRRRSSEEEEY